MEGTGLRRYLQPLFYFGLAAAAHVVLFLIPVRLETGKAGESTRGMRVAAVKQAVSSDPARSAPAPPTPRQPSDSPSAADAAPGGGPQGGGRSGGDVPNSTGQGSGAPGPGAGPAPVTGERGGAPQSAFGSYLAKLRSDGVQGWARDSAGKAQKGWRGSGKGGGGAGWGTGSGFGEGSGDGTGSGHGAGPGTGTGGKGSGDGGGGGYLDPRVQVVVTSYPPTSIEKTHGYVRYPDKKVKKHQYASGWWNVFIQINTDAQGNVVSSKVLRPETDGPLQRIFIQQVKDEVSRWSFERASAEVNVDVRFYVE